MEPGLASLIHPHSLDDFMADTWPQEPFVVHDLKDTVQELTNLPFLQSLDALLSAWPHPIQVHLPDVSDEASAIDANAVDAKKLFTNKMALLFNKAHRLSPVLTKWLAALQVDLGLPAMTYARCMLYATPDGKGTAPHFDQNVNFILQLHGTKKWWLAPNEHVENPTQRHTMNLEVDPELATYSDVPMPTEMPEESQEVVLRPGSLLFVPRGFWHRTEAEGEALALNFTFSQPTWIDLFTAALRSRLTLSPHWRELADGVSSTDPDRREFAQQKLEILLMQLQEDMPNWQAADIIAATEGLAE